MNRIVDKENYYLTEGLLKSGANIYLLYSFLKRLSLKFEEWDAYDLGIIDKDGNIIKKTGDLTKDERKSFSKFDVMMLNIKKLISKAPGGSSRLASFAAALYLLKEGNQQPVDDILFLSEKIKHYITLIEQEDVAANSATNIANNAPPIKLTNKKLLLKNKLKQ